MFRTVVLCICNSQGQVDSIVDRLRAADFLPWDIFALMPVNSSPTAGDLMGLGIPTVEAELYGGRLNTGKCLVAIHAYDDDEVVRAKEIYMAENAHEICITGPVRPRSSRFPKNGPEEFGESMRANEPARSRP